MSKDRPAGMDDLGSLHKRWPKPNQKTPGSATSMSKVADVASGRIETGKETAKVRGASKAGKGGGAA